MGWTTWNLQAIKRPEYGAGWLNSANVRVQADAMHRLLQSHGYNYVNIDSGWAGGYDEYGRPTTDLKRFPEGIDGLAKYLHSKGQKIGIYWIPGVQKSVYDANPPILGTKYHVRDIVAEPHVAGNAFGDWHMKIDFKKPGAQEFIDSIAALWASWGIDYLKIDGVGPGSDATVDSRDDIKAYSEGFRKTGRNVWIEVSWRVDHQYAGWWKKYAQGRRVNDDGDALTTKMTNWNKMLIRYTEAPLWTEDAGPGKGWNDFDGLAMGNGDMAGLNDDERLSVVTFWAINCAPFYWGDDLTKIDALGLKLMTNDEVIAVNQAGRPAVRMAGGAHQVWRVDNADGTCTVALINLGDQPAKISADWGLLGIDGSQPVRDLWSRTDLGSFQGSFSATLNSHATRLVCIGRPKPADKLPPAAVSGVRAAAGQGAVRLTWNPSPGAARYIVWRSASAHSGYIPVSARVYSAGYTDRTVKAGTPYYYQVSAVAGAGTSVKSRPVNAVPQGANQSDVISIDFVGDAIAMDQDERAGAVPAINWNCAPCRYGEVDLSDGSGTATSALLKYDAGGTYSTPIKDLSGGNRMMKGYLETYGHDTTKITVSGLPKRFTDSGYDVYVYCDGGNSGSTRVGKFQIGSQTVEVTDKAGSFYAGSYAPPSSPNANYAKFENVTGDTFTMLATPVSSTDPDLRAPINGIQIVARKR